MKINSNNAVSKTREYIIDQLTGILGETSRINYIENDTTVVNFKSDNIVIIILDLVEKMRDSAESLWMLSTTIILNGKIVLQKDMNGEGVIILNISKSINNHLETLKEGVNNGNIRNFTPKKSAI